MSLLILQAHMRRVRKPKETMEKSTEDVRSSTTTASTTSSGIGLYLEQKSIAILQAVNERNLDHPALKDVSPLYKTSNGSMALTSCKAQFLQNIVEVTRVNPDYHMTFLSATSEVDKVKGIASVWITHEDTGFPGDGLQRQNVKLFRWEQSAGRWWCMGHEGLRGSALV
jgi:hypothetical protein